MINTIEILEKTMERLKSSSLLRDYVDDRIYNWPKQDKDLPYVRASVDTIEFDDTKTERGYSADVTIDCWSQVKGDKEAMEMADIIVDLFHRKEFKNMSYQNIDNKVVDINIFIEPDRVTTHAVVSFNTLFTEE